MKTNWSLLLIVIFSGISLGFFASSLVANIDGYFKAAYDRLFGSMMVAIYVVFVIHVYLREKKDGAK
jgi:hypothetical protein